MNNKTIKILDDKELESAINNLNEEVIPIKGKKYKLISIEEFNLLHELNINTTSDIVSLGSNCKLVLVEWIFDDYFNVTRGTSYIDVELCYGNDEISSKLFELAKHKILTNTVKYTEIPLNDLVEYLKSKKPIHTEQYIKQLEAMQNEDYFAYVSAVLAVEGVELPTYEALENWLVSDHSLINDYFIEG